MKKETINLIKKLLVSELANVREILLKDGENMGSQIDISILDAYKCTYDAWKDFEKWLRDKSEALHV